MEEKMIGIVIVVLMVLGGLAFQQGLLDFGGDEEEVKTVQVKKVVDGDTIDVEIDGEEERVMILGIDTPEVHTSVEPAEWEGVNDEGWLRSWGHRASKFTKRWMTDEVELVFDSSAGKRGSYGRLLAYVKLPNGTDIGEELLKRGMARAYTNSDCEHKGHYVDLEEDAQGSGAGVWSGAALQAVRESRGESFYFIHQERTTITA